MERAEESGEYADCIRAAIRNVIDNPDAERWWLEKLLLPIDVREAYMEKTEAYLRYIYGTDVVADTNEAYQIRLTTYRALFEIEVKGIDIESVTNSDIDSLFLPYFDVRVAEAWEMAGLVLTVAASAAQSKLTEYYQRKVAEQATLNAKNNATMSNTLTDAQKSRWNALENTINDHLTEGDFSGTLRDLQGNPVPNGKGGYFDHLGEMKDSYRSLKKIRNGLEGSLKNPNLSDVDRGLLQEGLNKANSYIEKIDELFAPYGGIKK